MLTRPGQRRATPIAPVSGRVGLRSQARFVGGGEVDAVEFYPAPPLEAGPPTIATDVAGSSAAPSQLPSTDDAVAQQLTQVTPADLTSWLGRLQQAGVNADRWTSPNLLAQLTDALTRPIDTLICSLLDSDPWLPISRSVVTAYPREVAAGLGLLGRLTGARDWWALVDAADDTASTVRDAAARFASALRIGPVENDYPQLDPTLLVRSTTGRRLRPGRLPTSQGVLFVDAAAAAAVGRLVISGAAMTHVPVIVYDQPTDAIYGVSVAVGTRVGDLLSALGVTSVGRDLLTTSPLRQLKASVTDVFGPGELTLFIVPQPVHEGSQPCVRCGWCIEACPTRCRPAGLLEAAQQQDDDLAQRHGLGACIECGLCSFVCPSHLPLLAGIRTLKSMQLAD